MSRLNRNTIGCPTPTCSPEVGQIDAFTVAVGVSVWNVAVVRAARAAPRPRSRPRRDAVRGAVRERRDRVPLVGPEPEGSLDVLPVRGRHPDAAEHTLARRDHDRLMGPTAVCPWPERSSSPMPAQHGTSGRSSRSARAAARPLDCGAARLRRRSRDGDPHHDAADQRHEHHGGAEHSGPRPTRFVSPPTIEAPIAPPESTARPRCEPLPSRRRRSDILHPMEPGGLVSGDAATLRVDAGRAEPRGAGTSQPVISAYEHGRRDPSFGTLAAADSPRQEEAPGDAPRWRRRPPTSNRHVISKRTIAVCSTCSRSPMPFPARARSALLRAPRLVSAVKRLSLAEKVLAIIDGCLVDVPGDAFGGALALAYYAEPRATGRHRPQRVRRSGAHSRRRGAPAPPHEGCRSRGRSLIHRDGQARVLWDKTPIDLLRAYEHVPRSRGGQAPA